MRAHITASAEKGGMRIASSWVSLGEPNVRISMSIYLVSVAAFLSSGCQDQRSTQQLRTEVATLNQKLQSQSDESVKLEARLKDLEGKFAWSEFFKDSDKFAYLTPGATGYSVVRADIGNLTVELTDIKEYANGTKATLSFGNTMSASVNGLKATLDWGEVDAKGQPINDLSKSKEFTFPQSLRAGAWTKAEVILEGTPPQKLGFVRVKAVSHTGIALGR